MLIFLNELRTKHDNEDTRRLINEIELSLTEKNTDWFGKNTLKQFLRC